VLHFIANVKQAAVSGCLPDALVRQDNFHNGLGVFQRQNKSLFPEYSLYYAKWRASFWRLHLCQLLGCVVSIYLLQPESHAGKK
jgi:hypothetical protein